MDRLNNHTNSIMHANIYNLADIDASNYMSGLKQMYEKMRTNQKLQIIGILSWIIVAVLVIACIVMEGKSGEILLATILLSPILLAIGTISMVCASSDKRYVKSILDKIDSDISNRDYVIRKIMYGDKDCEIFAEKLNAKENAVYTGSFMPMSIKDGHNKLERYRYNGDKNYSAPFAYGMILEITYLRKSRVIDKINIVQ